MTTDSFCHQVNLEYLSRVVFTREGPNGPQAYPDTLVGTDSHTPMVNGLGVLGWGVGGIEAEAAMLGQPMSMLIPQVIGLKLTGELAEGTTATDLVLTVAELLCRIGAVGKFVDFFGPGVANVPLATRATLGVRAVLAVSFERIHRSNLIGMGVLPLQFQAGECADTLGLTGRETFSITGLESDEGIPDTVTVQVESEGQVREITATVRIDTPAEEGYYVHGGILPYVLRQLLAE